MQKNHTEACRAGTGAGERELEMHLFKLIGDRLGLLVPLEPHHVLGVEPPRLLLQRLRRQVLSLRALEEEGMESVKQSPQFELVPANCVHSG